MVERINGKTILTTPISAEDLKGIKIGDIVYLNGSMTTCRDVGKRASGRRKKQCYFPCRTDHPSTRE